jgi:hypothetical protein
MRRVCVTLFEAARWKHESTLVYGCVRITRGIQFCALPVPIVGTPRPILAVTDRHRFCAWCPVHLTGMSDLQCTKFVTTGVGVLVSLLGASRDENSEKRGGSLSLRQCKSATGYAFSRVKNMLWPAACICCWTTWFPTL